MMKKVFSITIDILGKSLLAWFVLQTFLYFYTGRFSEEINGLKYFGSTHILMDIYALIQIPFASVGVFVLIPLILKGYKSGLILGVLYWLMGYLINPLWYAFPKSMQSTANGEATLLLVVINTIWSIFSISVITIYYFNRRSLRTKEMSKQSGTQQSAA
ncbi:MAG: hypothetical protein GY705_16910 [Bacteroidetes bacterium]|nr:hypothetical protein [Bacteroidota bacterium]